MSDDIAAASVVVVGHALADVAPTLEHAPGRLQFVAAESEPASSGQVAEATVWAQRRADVGRRG
jgi:hypothetical protein